MVLSHFHPAIGQWFAKNLGEPTEPQRRGWPAIRAGQNTLIAAPTGSGKTLAAFLSAIDALLSKSGDALSGRDPGSLRFAAEGARQRRTEEPRAPARRNPRRSIPTLPEVRVLVRTGDTPAKTPRCDAEEAAAHPGHHARVALHLAHERRRTADAAHGADGHRRRDPRARCATSAARTWRSRSSGSRRSDRAPRGGGRLQRIGLSATQKPLEESAGSWSARTASARSSTPGTCATLDLAIEVPPSPLTAVCSHEQWDEIYERIAELVREHRTTLVFVNTRKMAERVAARLSTRLGADEVACHHGSLSAAAPARRRATAQGGRAQSAGGHRVARARHRHRRRRPGDPGRRDAIDRDLPPARRPRRPRRAPHAQGPHLPAHARRAGRSRGARAQHRGRGPRPHRRSPGARSTSWRSRSSPRACPRLGTKTTLFALVSPRLALPRPHPRKSSTRWSRVHLGGRWSLLHRDGVGPAHSRDPPRAHDRAHVGRRHPRHRRLPGDPRARGHAGRHPQRRLGHRVERRRHLPARQRVVAHLAGEARRRARGRRQGAPPTIPFWLGEAPARTAELSRRALAGARRRAHARDARVRPGVG